MHHLSQGLPYSMPEAQGLVCRVKGALTIQHSFDGALTSLKKFYARIRDDPPPMVNHTSCSMPYIPHEP